MKNKRTTKVTAALNNMNKTDIYSMMLFVLYKMRDLPDCVTLSELCYLIDGDNLIKLLSYFGGMTITIPTLRDFRLVLETLYLYQYVNIEGGNFEEGLKVVAGSEFTIDEIKNTYVKVTEVLAEYEFERE